MPDNVLRVAAEFDVAPIIAGTQKAVASFNELGTAVQNQAAKFKAAGLTDTELTSALVNLGYSNKEAIAAVAELGGASDETAGQIAILQTQVNQLSGALERATATSRTAAESVGMVGSAAKETRITTDLLTGNVSRAEQAMVRLASSSSVVGGILATAFPVFAAIALIDVLKSMSTAYDNLINSIAGWDAETQKAYDNAVSANLKLYVSTVETANQINNLNLVGKDGMEKFSTAAKDNAENLKRIGEATAVLQRGLAADNAELAKMQSMDNKIVEALGLASGEFEDHVKRLQKQIAETTATIDTLVAKQRELQNVEPQKNQAEASAEAIRLSRERREAEIEDTKAVGLARAEANKQNIEQLRAQGAITDDQRAALLQGVESDIYAIELKATNDRIALVKTEGSAHTAEVVKLQASLLDLSIKHDAQMRAIADKAANDDRARNQALAIGAIENAEAQAAALSKAAETASRFKLEHAETPAETKGAEVEVENEITAAYNNQIEALKKKAVVLQAADPEKNAKEIQDLNAKEIQLETERDAAIVALRSQTNERILGEQKKLVEDSIAADDQRISLISQQYANEASENQRLYSHKLESLNTYAHTAIAEAEAEYQAKLYFYAQETEAVRRAVAEQVLTEEEGSKRIQQIYTQEEKASQELGAKEKKTAEEIYQVRYTATLKYLESYNSSIMKMIDGEQTFSKTVTQIWQKMVNDIIQYMLMMVEKWITTHILMKLISEVFGQDDGSAAATAKKIAANEALIQSDAGRSAADVFVQAIEAIPFPGNLVAAPILAQTAYSEAIATAHFDLGGVVPGGSGVAVPAIVHGGERVLTPQQNVNFEKVAKGGRSGDIHVHINHQGSNMTQADMVRAVKIGIRKGQIGAARF